MSNEHLKKRLLQTLHVLALVALAYVVLQVLHHVQTAALILSAAILLAYLLRPLVSFFASPVTLWIPRPGFLRASPAKTAGESTASADAYFEIRVSRRGLPWMASLVLVYVLLAALVVLVVSFVVPIVVHEFKSFFSQGLPMLEAQTRALLENGKSWLMARMPQELHDVVPDALERVGRNFNDWVIENLNQLPPLMTRLVSMIAICFLVPVITFYTLLDMAHLKKGFMSLVPRRRQPEVEELLTKIDIVLGRYVRGQLLVALIIGTSIAVVLKLLSIQYALVIGLFAGIVNLIPYVGVVMGLVPALLVAFFMPNGGLVKALVVLLSMYAVHLTEGKLIVPTVVGRSVGLPPVIIIVSLIIGAEFKGLVGMLLAVPTAAILRVVVQHFVERRILEEDEGPPVRGPREEQAEEAQDAVPSEPRRT